MADAQAGLCQSSCTFIYFILHLPDLGKHVYTITAQRFYIKEFKEKSEFSFK